uniref:hypothetical protein n=1 Tax=Salmonella sp. s51090 TaxID=3159651 RepID=UPI00397F2750
AAREFKDHAAHKERGENQAVPEEMADQEQWAQGENLEIKDLGEDKGTLAKKGELGTTAHQEHMGMLEPRVTKVMKVKLVLPVNKDYAVGLARRE